MSAVTALGAGDPVRSARSQRNSASQPGLRSRSTAPFIPTGGCSATGALFVPFSSGATARPCSPNAGHLRPARGWRGEWTHAPLRVCGAPLCARLLARGTRQDSTARPVATCTSTWPKMSAQGPRRCRMMSSPRWRPAVTICCAARAFAAAGRALRAIAARIVLALNARRAQGIARCRGDGSMPDADALRRFAALLRSG